MAAIATRTIRSLSSNWRTSKRLPEARALSSAPDMPRRNIVTRGIRLNALRGKRFRVGDAVFEGLELCEPCSLFAKRTHPEMLDLFPRKAGLRARVVSGGEIRVGGSIEAL